MTEIERVSLVFYPAGVKISRFLSTFALHLAGLYKASDMSQTTIAEYFNRMYDLAQGKVEATLFEEADTTQYPLAEVIKKVFNIDYKPAKNGNNNDRNGSSDVAISNPTGEGGELRGAERPERGEPTPQGTEPTERTGGTESDSGTGAEVAPQPEAPAEPTEAQKLAGNYKKEHLTIDGHKISIENKKGSVRSGKDADGKEWHTEMHNDYGYIRGTEGVDGDHIDVYLSDTPEQGDVFVIDQYNPNGTFDEHKVMYGFPDEKSAKDAYLSNYEQGWEDTRRLDITHVSKDDFKAWVQSSKRKTKPFAEYKSVKPVAPEKAPEAIERNGVLYDNSELIETPPANRTHMSWYPHYEKQKELNEKYPGAIVLQHIGAQYEVEGNDAEILSELLGIECVERSDGKISFKLATIPERDFNKHIDKLKSMGKRVVVWENKSMNPIQAPAPQAPQAPQAPYLSPRWRIGDNKRSFPDFRKL